MSLQVQYGGAALNDTVHGPLNEYPRCFREAAEKGFIKPRTAQRYIERATFLLEVAGARDMEHAVRNHAATMAAIDRHSPSDEQAASRKANYDTLLCVMRWTGQNDNPANAKQYADFRRRAKEIQGTIRLKYDKNEVSEKQFSGFIPFAKLIRTRERLGKRADTALGPKHMLMAFVTLLPPKRLEIYRSLRFVRGEPTGPGNFICVHPKDMFIRCTEFKTARSEQFKGIFRERVPTELQRIVRRSLAKFPRTFLLETAAGEQFSDHGLSKFLSKMLEAEYGRRGGFNLVRHAFSVAIDRNKLTTWDQKAYAYSMMHSYSVNLDYRFAGEKALPTNALPRIDSFRIENHAAE